MNPESVFLICNYGVLPAWLLLLAAPGWEWTQRIVHAIWIPVVLALVYLWGFSVNPGTPEGGSFSTLEGVMILFTNPVVALVGWVHYLAFDLFVGAWEARDARRRGIAHIWLIPCLFLTLMAGPWACSSTWAFAQSGRKQPRSRRRRPRSSGRRCRESRKSRKRERRLRGRSDPWSGPGAPAAARGLAISAGTRGQSSQATSADRHQQSTTTIEAAIDNND